MQLALCSDPLPPEVSCQFEHSTHNGATPPAYAPDTERLVDMHGIQVEESLARHRS